MKYVIATAVYVAADLLDGYAMIARSVAREIRRQARKHEIEDVMEELS